MRAVASARTGGQRALVLGDLALGRGAQRRRPRSWSVADQAVARVHPLLHLRHQAQPHQREEDEERAAAPEQLLGLGGDRARLVELLGGLLGAGWASSVTAAVGRRTTTCSPPATVEGDGDGVHRGLLTGRGG